MKNIFDQKLIVIAAFTLFAGCEPPEPQVESEGTLQDHVTWLADDERAGRLAGAIEESESANYIAEYFFEYGLIPAGDDGTFLQQFILEGPMPQMLEKDNHISRNVVGLIEGTENPDQYIIVGAHYDSQGMGGAISMGGGNGESIHNGADDNASGTAGLIYLADYFSSEMPKKSMIFVAFSGEEMGLLGSRFFVEQMIVDTENILAMINLDMIGRLNDDELTIFGTGTSDLWEEMINNIEVDSLNISTTPAGSGASDHRSFYEMEIPVLHYFTGTHDDYHRASDTADKVNYSGLEKVLDHVRQLIESLDEKDASEMAFIESTDPHGGGFDFEGVTLGVMPDYSYSGDGFRVDGVRQDEPGDLAGMQEGDIIIEMGESEISDIYDYMEMLGEFEEGDEVIITVRRSGEEIELDVRF
ncbi:MAG: M28 family peptidase [Balneolaceae bacterium]